MDLIEDDLGKIGFGADGAGVSEVLVSELVGVVPEHFALARGGAGFGFDTEKDGDVLVGVQSVGDEEGDDDDVRQRRQGVPFGDERSFLHVGVEDFAEDGEIANFFDLAFCCESGVVVEVGSVAHDEEGGLVEWEVSGDLFGAFEEEVGDFGVVSDGFAVVDNFFSDARDGTG